MSSYNIAKSFKLSGDDDRHLREIMDSTGLNQADALRLALEVTPILLQFATDNDPKTVIIEQQFERGRTMFLEKMTREELADAMLYVRERVGFGRFDSLLKRGQEVKEKYKRDSEWLTKARNSLLASFPPPYTPEQIAAAIQRVGGCSLPYAKTVFDRQWKKGDQLVQVSPGKYNFVQEIIVAPMEAPSK